MNDASGDGRLWRSRYKLIALLTLFATPLLLAVSAYFWSWPFSPVPDSRGELLAPVAPLEAFSATETTQSRARGRVQFTNDDMQGYWWLLVTDDDQCGLHCEANLFKVRQVRHAVGRESARVQTAYVGEASSERLQAVLQRHPQTRLILGARALTARLARRGVYIVDPNGNLVLYYERGAAAKDIKHDLRRLLKVSRIG